MVTPQISERSKQSEAGVALGKGHGYSTSVPLRKRWASPGTATSPNQTEPSGAEVIELGLLSGEGRLNVVTLPNCDSFRTTLLTEERSAHPASDVEVEGAELWRRT
jgi:hypothetical protein